MAHQGGQHRLSGQLAKSSDNRLSSGQVSTATSTALTINNQQQQQRYRQEFGDATNRSSSAAAAALASSPINHLHHHNQLTNSHSANQHHTNNSQHHHHNHNPNPPHHHFKTHQRRQSVARLLPDISKLRLLSWLVEASSELIQCDVAIMDGVYAKLNKSQESLLFWTTSHHHQHNNNQHQNQPQTTSQQHMSLPSQILFKPQQQQPSTTTTGNNKQNNRHGKQQPALPLALPVVSSNLAAKMKHQHQKLQRATKGQSSGTRSHHSLPITNYDSSSLAAVSISPSLDIRSSIRTTNSGNNTAGLDHLVAVCSTSVATTDPPKAKASTMPASIEQTTSNLATNNKDNNNEPFCDSNQSDDDDNSSAASSTTSSGIHGGGTSFSSASSSTSSSSTGANSSSSASSTTSDLIGNRNNNQQQTIDSNVRPANSAELLSEKIRRTVMEHNYLQNLLVNVIRQHDRQRDIINQQRRRQMSFDQQNHLQLQRQRLCQQRIDLIDIAEALDDGCLCMCHSQPRDSITSTVESSGELNSSSNSQLLDDPNATMITTTNNSNSNKASTLPASGNGSNSKLLSSNQPSVPSRKVRRLKKLKGSNNNNNNKNQFNRQDFINQLADKLCENCFETHYWLRGSPQIELMQKTKLDLATTSSSSVSPSLSSKQHLSTSLGSSNTLAQQALIQNQEQSLNNIIVKRNATFIKLVQQEVRSTISKSIELIDLIRKEIKSPESIKQKHLMKCFSSSIQLLTSVGNYVVPAQDISSFIPEVGQQQTTLFRLPPSDFDHLLHYPTPPSPLQVSHQHQSASRKNSGNNNNSNSQYHLASAPDIPIRRRFNQLQIKLQQQNKLLSDSNGSLPTTIHQDEDINGTPDSNTQFLSLNLQRLRTSDTLTSVIDSSSGASSNNSSASSSIARGGVQQSSLTRAQTSSAILDGKTSHDLSLEAIADLAAAAGTGRQHVDDEDPMFFQSRPKFWQSSKFNFIKKLLHVKQQRLLRQQSKDRRIYNNKVQNKFRLVMMDLTHFNKSQQLLTTENGVNSLLTSMRNVLEFGLYLTLKLY